MLKNLLNKTIISNSSKFFAKSSKSLLKKKDYGAVIRLLVVTFILIVLATILFTYSEKIKAKKEKREPVDIIDIIGFNDKYSLKQILVGMASNFLFGFIDNAGLFFGMDALDPFLPGGILTKAGYGNTYSDALGIIVGTFIGGSIINFTNVKTMPLWSEMIGIVLGCLAGIYIPSMITGKS